MNLGEMLRDARIAARISIEDLSNATSIRIGLLTEMEANNFSHCGGDTYARGHIRNIANKLGADAAALIDIFNEEHSTERRAMQDLLVENNVMNSRPEGKKISWKVPAVISLSILVVLAIIQIVISNQSSTPKPVASQRVATPSPIASAEPAPQASTSAQPSAQPSATTSRKGPITLMMVATRGSSYIDIIVDGKVKIVDEGRALQWECGYDNCADELRYYRDYIFAEGLENSSFEVKQESFAHS